MASRTNHPTPRLCCVGDFAWDVVIRTDDALEAGGDTFGEVVLSPGGSAANTAVWAARCGAETHFVGKVGTDRLGRMAHADLAAEGVIDHMATTGEHATGAVASFVDHTGERSMVSGHGADHFLTPDDVSLDVLTQATHVHITGWSLFIDPPRAAAMHAARSAKEASATVSFDPSSFQLIEQMGAGEFLSLTTPMEPDLLFPNHDEGAALTGETEPARIAAALSERFGGAIVALKLGAAGALVHVDGAAHLVETEAARAVDTTGAGDSFAGAYLAAQLSGATHAEAAAAGCRVAGWVIGRLGARPAPDHELDLELGRLLP